MLQEKVIELNRVKIILLISGAIIFVLIGAFFLSLSPESIESQHRHNSPTLIYGIGITSISFFGLCGLVGLRKLFDRSPGLIISSEGIFDNSSGVSAGMVPWSDIVGIGEYQVQKQKFITIHVIDPNKYASRGNALKRMANRANIRMYGTPVSITSNTLKISYSELLSTINTYYQNSVKKA